MYTVGDVEQAIKIVFTQGGAPGGGDLLVGASQEAYMVIEAVDGPPWALLQQRTPVSSQERATAYLNGLKASPEGWKFCVERFSPTPHPEVKFWCLQTLHEVRRPSRCAGAACCCRLPRRRPSLAACSHWFPLPRCNRPGSQVVRAFYTQMDAPSQSAVSAVARNGSGGARKGGAAVLVPAAPPTLRRCCLSF